MSDAILTKPKLVCCSLSGCVHVAGAANFAALADRRGVAVSFLGADFKVDIWNGSYTYPIVFSERDWSPIVRLENHVSENIG